MGLDSWLEKWRKAKPEDQAAVMAEAPAGLSALRDAMAKLPAARPAPPPGRPEMAADERRALGEELARRQAGLLGERERLAASLADAEKRRQAADEELARLCAEQSDMGARYTSWRDPVMARLWAERPALADELIARTEEEARTVTAQARELPPEGFSGGYHLIANDRRLAGEIVDPNDRSDAQTYRTVSNRESVERRRKALWGLAEAVRDWTAKGLYGSAVDLQRMFDRAYAALPAVEPLRDVLKRDDRGRKFVKDVPARLPPAA